MRSPSFYVGYSDGLNGRPICHTVDPTEAGADYADGWSQGLRDRHRPVRLPNPYVVPEEWTPPSGSRPGGWWVTAFLTLPEHDLLAAAAAMLPVDWVAIGERTVYVRAAPPWDTDRKSVV